MVREGAGTAITLDGDGVALMMMMMGIESTGAVMMSVLEKVLSVMRERRSERDL